MFRYVMLSILLVPAVASAAVGISPSAIEAKLPVGATQEGKVLFMRDEVDTNTEMYVTVFSTEAFLLTEGTVYHMPAGVREIEIPYRFESATYVLGTYEGILYIRPERASEGVVEGVRVQVQGGVRAKMTVTAPEEILPRELVRRNIHEHIQLYRETVVYYINTMRAYVKEVF